MKKTVSISIFILTALTVFLMLQRDEANLTTSLLWLALLLKTIEPHINETT